MSEEVKRKRGHPKTDDPRIKEVRVRLTEEEFDRLTRYAERSGRTKSDILRSAISEATTVNDWAWDDSHCRTPERRAAFFGDFMD